MDDQDIGHAVRYPVRTALITDPETGEVRHLYIGVDPADLHDASDLRTIALAHDARPYGEEPVLAAVAAARLAGRTWAEIGLALGMSRQSAHSRFAARLDQAMMVRVQAALVERKGRQVIEAELKTEHVPSDALFSMRISLQPFGSEVKV